VLDRSRKSIEEGKGLSKKAFWDAVRKRAQAREAATDRRKASAPKKQRRTKRPG
jgi:hypothetical protein